MKALVDLNVVLNRQPFFADSAAVWNAHSAVDVCLNTFAIVAVDQTLLLAAQTLSGSDFEDNVCIACAMAISADWIVTRDVLGFKHSVIAAIEPAGFNQQLRIQRKPLP